MDGKDTYDAYGNAANVWFEAAVDLLTATAELKRQLKISTLKTGIPFSRSSLPKLMLRAFAVECLIKAHFLLPKTKKLCEGGKYVGIVRNERHDLRKLAHEAKIPLSEAEEDMLDRLSTIAIGSGRYPILKHFDGPKLSSGKPGGAQWTEPQDETVFRNLIIRLFEPYDSPTRLNLYGDLLRDA